MQSKPSTYSDYKLIIIEDSYRRINGQVGNQYQSDVIRGRSPFSLDNDNIDYDIDSEEEFEEENGEDVDSKDGEDDDDEQME